MTDAEELDQPVETAEPQRKKTLFQRMGQGWRLIAPDRMAWRGAAFGVALLGLALLVWVGLSYGGAWLPATVAFFVLVGAGLAFLTGALADLLFSLLARIPAFARNVLIGVGVVLGMLVFGRTTTPGALLLTGWALLSGGLLGGGLWTLLHRGERLARPRRWAALHASLLGAAVLVGGLAWYLSPGEALVAPSPVPPGWAEAAASHPAVGDPSSPGPYAVQTLTYGSGSDRHLAEYGAAVSLRTEPVDGSPLVGNWSGLPGWLRTSFWGFDAARLPLNARVWYPEGDGPFPLVLIVHGNHTMMDFSDPGYEYLGQLFASRGIIAASVDENFLNGAWIDLSVFGMKGLDSENDARGWLLLEHLSQWRRWNRTEGSPFYGKVDMQRIALVGHSRGGEAAAVAAAFNNLPAHPDNGWLRFDYHFNIRGVAAIAPSDGQYQPSGRALPLEGISYLVMQGAYDGDVTPFAGIRQYNRVSLGEGSATFKAALYFDRGNHGQFNQTWGRSDLGNGFPVEGLLNRAQILPEADQQQIAKVFLSAFVETVLKESADYRALFRDARAGAAWLPELAYVNRYADGSLRIATSFDEDINLETGLLPGSSISGDGLTLWYEREARLKAGDQDSSAVYLGWDTPFMQRAAVYRLNLGAGAGELRPSESSLLVFSLSGADINPNPRGGAVPVQDDGIPLDLTVELVDSAGRAAHLPLSRFMPVPEPIRFYPMKHPLFEKPNLPESEAVFQSYAFPLADFQQDNPAFDPGSLVEIRFVFDRSPRGVIVLDDIGLADSTAP